MVTFKNEVISLKSGQGEGSGAELTVESMKLDLSSLASVKEFVKAFKEKFTHLNYLVHCDGVVFVRFGESNRGSTGPSPSLVCTYFIYTFFRENC